MYNALFNETLTCCLRHSRGELELSVFADVVRHTHTDKQTKRHTKFEVGTTHPTVCVQASILIWTPTFTGYQA